MWLTDRLRTATVTVTWCLGSLALAVPAIAQEPVSVEHHHPSPALGTEWTWATDANVLVGFNAQRRHFASFSDWESQNWFMGGGERPLGAGRLQLLTMLSLESLTLPATGSPQLFQTGESYKGTPLVNLQHPHDLLMGLGATYQFSWRTLQVAAGADLVGMATLGPTAFMHRESARDNPQVPLTHHYTDSTHISAGVVRAGVSRGPLTLEASAFRGAEPDDNRRNLERPRLDSWAVRGRFDQGRWHTQVSVGHLKQPEWFEPYDQTRITASVGFEGAVAGKPLAVTALWGGTREFNGFNGDADGYLLEWDLRATTRSAVYGRAEVADKELFGLGYHPKGFAHRHVFFKIGALTTGYIFDVSNSRRGRVGLGIDATVYHMPSDVADFYGGSRSFHAFLRWRPAASMPHVH